MAAKTTTQAGNWSDGATWGGTAPVAGDTVTIAHNVTADSTIDIGHSPGAGDATAAILVNSGITLTLSGSVVMTVRGDIRTSSGSITATGTGTLQFDASNAATPSTARYVLAAGVLAGNPGLISITGTDNDNRFTLRTTGSGANARLAGAHGMHSLQYVNVTRFGDSSNNSFTSDDTSRTGNASIRDSTLDQCGLWDANGSRVSSITRLNRVLFTNRLHATRCATMTFNNITLTTGIREAKYCSFDGLMDFDLFMTGVEIEGNFSTVDGLRVASTASPDWTTFKWNLVQWQATTIPVSCIGPFTENYWLSTLLSGGQYHGPGVGRTSTHQGNIFDSLLQGAGESDILLMASSGTYTATIRNNLVLPSIYGSAQGVLVSCLGNNAGTTLVMEHNTAIGGTAVSPNGMLRVGETNAGRTGMVTSFKSNLTASWSHTVANYYSISGRSISGATKANPCVVTSNGSSLVNGSLVRFRAVGGMTELNSGIYTVAGATTNTFQLSGVDSTGFGTYTSGGEVVVLDHCLPANATNNGTYNGVSGQDGRPYLHDDGIGPFSDTTFGANDVTGDPLFVDASTAGWRFIGTFDVDYLGDSTGTAWADSTSYAVGDIVSRSSPALWGSGSAVNFRCISAHTSATATDAPGTGSAWTGKWEFAAVNRLRLGVPTNTYDGVTPKPTVQDLLEWVKNGWRPTNGAYEDAGHDGVTIGALEGVFGSTVGAAAGTSDAAAVGASFAAATGSVEGIASVSGVGEWLAASTGTAAGTSDAAAVLDGLFPSAGTATGSSEATGYSGGAELAVAESAGTSTAEAISAPIWYAVGLATGYGEAEGIGQSTGIPTTEGVWHDPARTVIRVA